ncbi:hypothetical protein Ciccas_004826 [Cichlidogyrus casuarinus]|uniref:Metalloprotease TIKI homolog n=1 Tax=Cichlidogyrus casuarinus TaxID=1844966 RepID=A0ABD2QCP9_9PLAT
MEGTSEHLHSSNNSLDNLIFQYNCGDLHLLPQQPEGTTSSFRDVGVPKHEASDEFLYRELIVNRNKKMTAQIIRNLKTNRGKSLFFALGAGHFLGSNDTVVEQLQRAGYAVVPVKRSLKTVSTAYPDSYYEMDTSKDLPNWNPKVVQYNNLWFPISEFNTETVKSGKKRSSNQADTIWAWSLRQKQEKNETAAFNFGFFIALVVPLTNILLAILNYRSLFSL